MKIEVSIGEVVDKITILLIKQDRIKDSVKLAHIKHESSILNSSLSEEGILVPIEMIDNLLEINEKLWDVEDLLRKRVELGMTDQQYIANAELDAKLNDDRFLVKHKINNHFDSTIKEQKSYDGLYQAN